MKSIYTVRLLQRGSKRVSDVFVLLTVTLLPRYRCVKLLLREMFYYPDGFFGPKLAPTMAMT